MAAAAFPALARLINQKLDWQKVQGARDGGGGGAGGSTSSQLLADLLPDPAAPGLIPRKTSEENIVNVAEVNQRRFLEENGQSLENFD